MTCGEHQTFAEVDARPGPIFLWDPHDIDGEWSEGFIEILPIRRKCRCEASTNAGYPHRPTKVGALLDLFLLLNLHAGWIVSTFALFELGLPNSTEAP